MRKTGKPVRIGYFGGTFDPPHRGHLAVARAARDRFHLDRVLLAPTGRQPLKPNGPEASWADRLHMTELLCTGEPGLEASAIDGPRPHGEPNYTVDTLRRLHIDLAVQYPEQPTQIFALLGADAFQHLPKWREPGDLLQLAQWIIVSRPGYPLGLLANLPLTPQQNKGIHLLQDLADRTSATDIRRRLARGETVADAMPEAIHRYILANRLYCRIPPGSDDGHEV